MNSKDLIKLLLLRKELDQLPFVPLVCSFAARLRQISVKELLTDPTCLANSLRDAQRLFGYDAVINVFDPTLEAEALGCGIEWQSEDRPPRVVSHPLAGGKSIEDLSVDFEKRGRLPIVLEATRRIKTVMGGQVAIIGVVTGPITLSKHLQGDSFLAGFKEDHPDAKKLLEFAKRCSLSLLRSYCEVGADVALVIEDVMDEMDVADIKKTGSTFKSLWNVLRYFQVHSLFLAHRCDEGQLEMVCGLGADGVILNGQCDLGTMSEVAQKHNCCFGATIPMEVLLTHPEQVKESVIGCLRKGREAKGFFLSSEWEIPYATPPENMHEIVRGIQEA